MSRVFLNNSNEKQKPQQQQIQETTKTINLDVCIIGAGFSGMYQLHKLRMSNVRNVRIVEAGSSVGGTWYWNRYPGCRCDVPSVEYSYSFDEDLQQEWNWTEK